MTQQPDWEEVGHIGDVSWPEYDGGPVFVDRTGVYAPELEYVQAPPENIEFSDPNARWTISRVVLDPEVPSWGDINDVAQTMGADPEELAAAFVSDDPIQRAGAYADWAGYYGWHEFDQEQRELTCAEINERYDADLDCYGEIQTKLEEAVQQMVDESAAQSWSNVDDQTMIDLEQRGYDDQSAFNIAEFGSEPTIAVNTDVLIHPDFAREIGIKSDDKILLWSVEGTREFESWLEKNGYEVAPEFGGNVPTTEGYAYAEHVIQRVAREMELPIEAVTEAAKALEWWQEEIPGSTDGFVTLWAKPVKKENDVDEAGPRHSAEAGRPKAGWRNPSSIDSAYDEALAFLGKRDAKKAGPNTDVIRGDGNVLVRYHGNLIVIYEPGRITLNSQGYRTYTTKERINWFLPEGYGLFQKRGEWFVQGPGGTEPFKDGMVLASEHSARAAPRRRPAREARAQDGCPPGSRSYMARYVHQISPKPTDVGGPFCIRDGAWSDRKTLAAALRKAGVLDSGARVREFRVEGERIIVFPSMPGMTTYWHSVILTPND